MADVFPGAKLVQLVEWGYPKGARRSPVPSRLALLATIHITANPGNPPASAEGEAAWRKNDPALQNSATFFVNRNGTVVQCLGNPMAMAPWANGFIRSYDASNRRIARIVADKVNPNLRTVIAIENVGREPAYPITREQVETNARIVAHYSRLYDIPVTRTTVVGHYQIDGVERRNCPSGPDKALIDRIVARANELLNPEADMILLPVDIFPPGTSAVFRRGVKYDLWKPKADGTLDRKEYIPETGDKVARHAIGRFVLNGDDEHPAILMATEWQYLDGWFVSSWGNLPTLRAPEPTADCAAVEQQLSQALKLAGEIRTAAVAELEKTHEGQKALTAGTKAAVDRIKSL